MVVTVVGWTGIGWDEMGWRGMRSDESQVNGLLRQDSFSFKQILWQLSDFKHFLCFHLKTQLAFLILFFFIFFPLPRLSRLSIAVYCSLRQQACLSACLVSDLLVSACVEGGLAWRRREQI